MIEILPNDLDLDNVDPYLPMTRRGHTRRKVEFGQKLTRDNKLRLVTIDRLSHAEAANFLTRRKIIRPDSEAPTHLLKNMLVALMV